jgi:hypothetical protein
MSGGPKVNALLGGSLKTDWLVRSTKRGNILKPQIPPCSLLPRQVPEGHSGKGRAVSS